MKCCSYCSGYGIVGDYGAFGEDFYGDKECPKCEGSGYTKKKTSFKDLPDDEQIKDMGKYAPK